MRIIKNSRTRAAVLLLGMLSLIAGCMPEGSRALLEGKNLVEKGRYLEAIERLKVATSLMNTNAIAWDYLGLACHHAGQITNAVQAYQRVLALDQDMMVARYNLGCLWMEQGELERAKAEFTTYTLRQSQSLNGWLRLAATQSRLRDLTGAEKSYGEALRIAPKSAEAMNGIGVILVERNRPRDAVRFFETALKVQPDYGPALLNLAVVSQRYVVNRPLALRLYRNYLALPVRSENWDSVNAIVRELEQELNPVVRQVATNVPATAGTDTGTGSAHATARSATDVPKAPPARAEVAESRLEPVIKPAQEVPSSSPTATRAEAGKPSTVLNGRTGAAKAGEAEAGQTRANNLEVTSNGGPGDATTGSLSMPGEVSRYSYRHPARPVGGDRAAAQRAFTQGAQAQRSGRLPEAIQAYRQATQLDPAYYEAYYNLGLAAAAAGNMQQSLSAYEMALAIRPESIDARYNFAIVLKQANYAVDAARELERLLAAYPNEARAHLALGILYAGPLAQERKAREHYLKVLEIDPSNPQAPAIRSWLSARSP